MIYYTTYTILSTFSFACDSCLYDGILNFMMTFSGVTVTNTMFLLLIGYNLCIFYKQKPNKNHKDSKKIIFCSSCVANRMYKTPFEVQVVYVLFTLH